MKNDNTINKVGILTMLLMFLFASCNTGEVADVEANIDELNTLKVELAKLRNPKLMHTVYVWLKDDLDKDEMRAFLDDAMKIGDIESVARFRLGKAAKTEERAIVDNTYTIAMNIEFNSIQDQKAYQDDSIHVEFVKNNNDRWDKVIVYDNVLNR